MANDVAQDENSARILVVDDLAAMRWLQQRVLVSVGHEVLMAADGKEAMTILKEEKIDLVLVDYQLPDLFGSELCQQIKNNYPTRGIPVIIVTSEDSSTVAEECFTAGATDFVRKPFSPRELLARVKTTLQAKMSTEALQNWKAAISKDLEVAGALQRTLASASPLIGLDYQARAEYLPSQHVGGDFLDMIPLPNGESLIYVGDVAGHGVASAMVSSLMKSILTTFIQSNPDAAPYEICNELHEGLRARIREPSVYATLILFRFNPETKSICMLRCGHPPPVCAPSETIPSGEMMLGGGPPIGFPEFKSPPFSIDQEVTVSIPEGSALLFYTDGLSEAVHHETGEELEIEGVQGLFENVFQVVPESELISEILFKVNEAGFLLNDDCSMLLFSMNHENSIIYRSENPIENSSVEAVAIAAEKAMQASEIPEDLCNTMQLVLMEHLGNVVRHSGKKEGQLSADPVTEDQEETMTVQLRRSASMCEMLLMDPGKAWAIEKLWQASMPRDQMSESGRGLPIIKKLSSAVEQSRRNRTNVTVYYFKLPS